MRSEWEQKYNKDVLVMDGINQRKSAHSCELFSKI